MRRAATTKSAGACPGKLSKYSEDHSARCGRSLSSQERATARLVVDDTKLRRQVRLDAMVGHFGNGNRKITLVHSQALRMTMHREALNFV
jgi:hypothetical protein